MVIFLPAIIYAMGISERHLYKPRGYCNIPTDSSLQQTLTHSSYSSEGDGRYGDVVQPYQAFCRRIVDDQVTTARVPTHLVLSYCQSCPLCQCNTDAYIISYT